MSVAGKRMGALEFDWHLDEFERIRKSEGIVSFLEETGKQLVSGLNAELHAAQRARNQPVEDGYKFYVTNEGDASRARLHVLAFTTRAQAHEAVHQSILKRLGEAAATTSAGRTAERALARAERDAARRTRAERQRAERGDD
ncbi:hypothetical protein SEA_NERGAL_15 [Mycobacterium Phage Nergal]|nr:hypothetical protein SEA_NERGAL_15 [Mycobacterium Phage Nergal]